MKLKQFKSIIENTEIEELPQMPDQGDGQSQQSSVVKPPIKNLETDEEKKDKRPPGKIKEPKILKPYFELEKTEKDYNKTDIDSILDKAMKKLISVDNYDENQLKKLQTYKKMNTEQTERIHQIYAQSETFDDFLDALEKTYG